MSEKVQKQNQQPQKSEKLNGVSGENDMGDFSSFDAPLIQRLRSTSPELQEKIDNSPQAKKTAQLQTLADNSPRVQYGKSIQRLVNKSPQVLQSKRSQEFVNSSPRVKNEKARIVQMFGGKNSTTHNEVRKPQNSSTSSNKMPNAIQAKMENSFGQDFSGVNIHTNSQNANSLNALAYTQGKDIHFAPGQYNPESKKGQELLGHELTHVVQQSGGNVQPTTQLKGVEVNDSTELEQEADDAGKLSSEGKPVEVSGKGSGIQKASDLDAISAPNKKGIQISTDTVKMGNKLAELFDKGVAFSIEEPVKSSTVFTGVNEDMKDGLRVYAQSILHILEEGGSITRKLNFKIDHPSDISAYTTDSQDKLGKVMTYRFTHYKDAATQKSKVIIEELGEYKEAVAASLESYELSMKSYGFTFISTTKKVNRNGRDVTINLSFTPDNKRKVYKMLSMLPPEALNKIKGVKFQKDARSDNESTTNGMTEQGHYDSGTHTISLMEDVFIASDTVYGDVAAGFFNGGDQTILHEVGHAIDSSKHAELFKLFLEAQDASNNAIEAYNKSVDDYNAAKNSANMAKVTANKSTMDAKKLEKNNARTRLLNAISPSGKKMTEINNVFDFDGSTYVNAYTTAEKADGEDVTVYAETSKEETFAESFSLYYVDKNRFNALRAKQKAYFDAKGYL